MKKMYGSVTLFICAAIWGFAFVAQSVGMDYVEPFTFLFSRSVVGGVFLMPVIAVMSRIKKKNGASRPVTPQLVKKTVIGGRICGVVFCVASAFQQIGIMYTTVGKSGFLTTMYIIIVPILGIFVGKRPQKKVILCVILAVIGLYLISMNEQLRISRGDTLVIICAFCFALQIMAVDHFGGGVDGVVLSCIQLFSCGLVALPFMLIFETPSMTNILAAAIPVLYAGVMSSGVAYTLQIIGQQHCDPTVATILMSLESVFSMIGGIIILHQIPTLKEGIGCFILFSAVILVQVPILEGKKKQKQ